MRPRRLRLINFVSIGLLLSAAGMSPAAQVRFHYVPVDAAGNSSIQPTPGGSPGERVRWLGAVHEPYYHQPRPTHILTFQHLYSQRPITVPLSFPAGTPRIEHVRDRIIYNYGSYSVQAHFLADGSVDVIYDSGLFRSP
jgi:hypothetical protein